ncbi:sigma 54-interacting transcriptional regulator [Alicyclobacillus curvatus]|nr:sigma 54-interacting transcriptional regulator [Alicyclobacillus curvatus]
MTRKEKVLAALRSLMETRDGAKQNHLFEGFTTAEIADKAGVLRTNCSAALNELVRDGLIEKTHGRPALYRVSGGIGALVSPSWKSLSERSGLSELPERQVAMGTGQGAQSAGDTLQFARGRGTDFDWGVATERSLHDAVQQAKIALTYPPHGMHVLLLGETGVGKSTFSRRMHEYAVRYGVLSSSAPFIAFNCSEYANNQEILLDQLFGHVRGAYTGAHSDKMGLVEQASGGMLFLDEVHRLPPQGQEMLFHLLDFGLFRRLGETGVERRSRVLLVAATTESPESALLSTFRRRIPVVIRLPALREWALHDRYELVFSICKQEAVLLEMPIRISAAALDTLLFSRFSANIGDLKNTIKMACARAYNKGVAGVVDVLPEHVVIPVSDARGEVLLRSLTQSADLIVTPNSDGPPSLPMLEEGSMFAKVDRLGQSLYELGFDTEEILESLERQLQKQSRREAENPSSVADLRHFVGEPLFSSMARAWKEIEHGLAERDRETAFLRVAVHLYGVIRSARTAGETNESSLVDIVLRVRADLPDVYNLSGKLLNALQRYTGVTLPDYETAIVAMLLRPQEEEEKKRIGLVTALFGDAIARHMVDTASLLTGSRDAIAIDIPIQTSSEAMDTRLSEAVARADGGKGVIILTDVPRFADGGGWQPPPGMQVARVLRPDLRTVVSAMQAIEQNKLDTLQMAGWLRARNQDLRMLTGSRKRIVWGICLTGKGTARAVERLIRDALPHALAQVVEVIPKELGHSEAPLIPDEGLVAAVGSVDPGIVGVPFFSVETLLTREGIEQLLSVLYLGDVTGSQVERVSDERPIETERLNRLGRNEHVLSRSGVELRSDVPDRGDMEGSGNAPTRADIERYIADLLHRDLVFVNPDLALRVSKQVWYSIETLLASHGIEANFKRETFVRFCLHMAYVIERLLKQEDMTHPYVGRIAKRYPLEWSLMALSWQPVTDVFRIPVNEHELAYLFELVFVERELEVFD